MWVKIIESDFANLEFGTNVEVLDHLLELIVGDLPVVVLNYHCATKSALMIVRSTSCCSCRSVRLFPTIIFSTVKSYPFEMNPSLSMS